MHNVKVPYSLVALLLLGVGGHSISGATQSPGPPPKAPVEFEVVARQFEFEPARLEVSLGDHVRILVRSDDKVHGFAIPTLKINRILPSGGKVETIEFDARTAGTFEILCSEACGKGHKDMKGSLVVLQSEGRP